MCLCTIHTWDKCEHEMTEWQPCKKLLKAQRRPQRWSRWFCISTGSSSRPVCQVTNERVGNQYSCPECIAKMNKSLDRLKRFEDENRRKVAARQQQEEKEQLARKKKQAEEQHAARTQRRKEVAARLQQEADQARDRAWDRAAVQQQGRGRAHADSYIDEDLYRQCFEALSEAEPQDQRRGKPALPPLQIPSSLPSNVGRHKGKVSSGPTASIANAGGRHRAINNHGGDVQSWNQQTDPWKRPDNPGKHGKPGSSTAFDSPTIPVPVKSVAPAPASQVVRRAPVSRGAIVRNAGNVQRQQQHPYVAPPHSVQYRPLPLREVEVKARPVHEIAWDFGNHIPKGQKIVHETSDEYGEPLPGDDFLDDMTRNK
ncbi:hypothetical protein DL546_003764 [Coniochaeta pulveracea]|uniref:Uncharacterized protein n=1 Tax=Coniochaeta pulveracea TaxID=177199 RepID=A0A420XZ01_9PEZI|nr:hypothetical protein DL546_003764 [Coniochaeta pulveracea]